MTFVPPATLLALAARFGARRAARPPGARAEARTVYVNSYGGVWETSWKKAFFDPFTAQTGIEIKTVPGVSFAKLKAQVQSQQLRVGRGQSRRRRIRQAVLEGLLEKVDRSAAKADQLPPNIVREYGITSYSLGTNLVYRKDKFPNGGPQSWADFWDVKKFPGPALPVRPFVHLPRLRAACRRRARPTSSIPWISTAHSAR